MSQFNLMFYNKLIDIIQSLLKYVFISIYNELITCYFGIKQIIKILATVYNYKNLSTFNYKKVFNLVINELKLYITAKKGFLYILLLPIRTIVKLQKLKQYQLFDLITAELTTPMCIDKNIRIYYEPKTIKFKSYYYYTEIYAFIKVIISTLLGIDIDNLTPFKFIINYNIKINSFSLYTFLKNLLKITPLKLNSFKSELNSILSLFVKPNETNTLLNIIN